MSDCRVQPDPADDAALPAALVEALRDLHPPGPPVPATVDEAVLAEARAGYARRRRFWVYARAAGAVAATAAAAVVVLSLYLDRERTAPAPVAATGGAQTQAAAGDVDGSGRVDVLDAYLLARRIGAAPDPTPSRSEDVNGDGVLDRRDVDAVAAMAVSVGASVDGSVGDSAANGGLR